MNGVVDSLQGDVDGESSEEDATLHKAQSAHSQRSRVAEVTLCFLDRGVDCAEDWKAESRPQLLLGHLSLLASNPAAARSTRSALRVQRCRM